MKRFLSAILVFALATLPAAAVPVGQVSPGLSPTGAADNTTVLGHGLSSILTSPLVGLAAATANTPGSGYAPGDTIVPSAPGLSQITAGVIYVVNTQVVSATVAAGGSGGTNGTQTVTGTTGSGVLFQASVTVSGGAISAVNSITTPGQYKLNPTSISAEPVTGAGLVGATLSLKMGVLYLNVQQAGAYTGLLGLAPTATQASSSGSGTGLNVALTIAPLAAAVIQPSQASNIVNGSIWTTAYGFNSLSSLTTGVENTMYGWSSGSLITTGSYNTGFGVSALGLGEVDGSNNSAFGVDSMRNTVHESFDTAVGFASLRNPASTGTPRNVAVGAYALQMGASTTGGDNVGLGFGAGASSSWTTGSMNTLIGTNAGNAITTGSGNQFIGHYSGYVNTTGSNNTFVGLYTAGSLVSGNNNVGMGYFSQHVATTGAQNSSFGVGTLQVLVNGGYNNAFGYNALSNITAGSGNTAFGTGGGAAVTTGNNNVFLGPNIGATGPTTGSNNILFGISAACNTPSVNTNDYFALCASTGTLPLMSGSLAATSLSLLINGVLSLTEAESHATSTVTASFTYDATMHNIDAGTRTTPLTAPVVATLPACVTTITGRTYGLKKKDTSTNAVTLTAATTNAQTGTADLIDGAATVALTTQYSAVNVQCNGAGDWDRGLQ